MQLDTLEEIELVLAGNIVRKLLALARADYDIAVAGVLVNLEAELDAEMARRLQLTIPVL
jgi:hypothetical protein